MIVVNALLDLILGFSSGGGATAVVPPMLAAMDAGHQHYKRNSARPEPSVSWAHARAFMAPNIILISVGIFALIAFGRFPKQYASDMLVLAGFVLAMLMFIFLINRAFFALGAKNMAMADQQKAKK
jgi:hypothetical protein